MLFGYTKIKVGIIAAVMALGVVLSAPNFMPESMYKQLPQSVRDWYRPVTLGLDLQGGSYLVMQVDTDALVTEKLGSLADLVRTALREEKIRFAGLKVENDALQVKILICIASSSILSPAKRIFSSRKAVLTKSAKDSNFSATKVFVSTCITK